MTQDKEQIISYQWIKGEKAGSVEEFDKEEKGFTYFKSGRRVGTDVIEEFLLRLEDGAIPLIEDIETKSQPISDPTLGLKVSDPQDPAAGLKVAGKTPAKRKEVIAVPDPPIIALLRKMGDTSKDDIEISLKMSIKIPKVGMYSIMEESFGEEVLENITGMALAQIDEEKIQNELQSIIKEKVKHYYEEKR